jgi:DNA-binding transcriptional MocR family regulator
MIPHCPACGFGGPGHKGPSQGPNPSPVKKASQPRYEQVADAVAKLIEDGTLRPGERAPSLRRTSERHGVSLATAVQAFIQLEARGLVESRPRSGYYVKARPREKSVATASPAPTIPMAGKLATLHASLFEAATLPGIVALGGAVPSADLLPTVRLNRLLAARARTAGKRGVGYDLPPGSEALRREIAKRMAEAGVAIAPPEILTTCGATEALMLALRAVARRGDAVAVECPTYFGILHVLEELGLEAVEIPMDEREGMDLKVLEQVLANRAVAACVSIPSFSNPLGSLMPEANKRRLVALLSARDIPLIEDDVFGELHFTPSRPRAAKSFDEEGLVVYCGSFSKSLAPGYRVGWIAPGRYAERVRALKLTHTLATATLPELAVADFLAHSGYDHYLRTARARYAENVARVSEAVLQSFPAGTKVNQPQGGFVLWVTLPAQVDAIDLYERALAQGVSFAPGHMFSLRQAHRNCLRISCGEPWSPKLRQAISIIAKLAGRLAAKP